MEIVKCEWWELHSVDADWLSDGDAGVTIDASDATAGRQHVDSTHHVSLVGSRGWQL